MSDAASFIVGLVLLVAGYIALIAYWRWIAHQAELRNPLVRFERDFIPEVADVAEQDTPVILEEIVALLEDSRTHVERLRKAAS